MAELFYLCEICSSVLEEHNCKAVCPNCGRTFDCSDLPALQANGKVEIENGQRVFIPRPSTSLANQKDKS